MLVTSTSTVANVAMTLLLVVGIGVGVAGWLGAAIVAGAVTMAATVRLVPYTA